MAEPPTVTCTHHAPALTFHSRSSRGDPPLNSRARSGTRGSRDIRVRTDDAPTDDVPTDDAATDDAATDDVQKAVRPRAQSVGHRAFD